MIYKIIAYSIITAFYAVYIGKLISQKKKGIQTNQIARGKKSLKLYYTELIMKIATYGVIAAEFISIYYGYSLITTPFRIVGVILGVAGVAVFTTAVWTMRDSWRAGIPEKDKTQFVTSGVYQYSRNPAFLGFDLVYIGILLMFYNWILFVFTVFAMIMLHLQILQEENYLIKIFGKTYLEYKKKVYRYFGKNGD